MPSSFLNAADEIATQLNSNPFSKWKLKLTLMDGASGEQVGEHIRDVSGTTYAQQLFDDVKRVLEGEADIVDTNG